MAKGEFKDFLEKLQKTSGEIPQVDVEKLAGVKLNVNPDLKKLILGGRGKMRTKIFVSTFGWDKSVVKYFTDAITAFGKETDNKVEIDLITSHNGDVIKIYLLVTKDGASVSHFCQELLESMGVPIYTKNKKDKDVINVQLFNSSKNLLIQCDREKIVENNGEEGSMPLDLGKLYGIIDFRNLESTKVFVPTIRYDWDNSVPYDTRVRTGKQGKGETRLFRMLNNNGFQFDFNYSQSYCVIAFTRNAEDNGYDFYTVRGQQEKLESGDKKFRIDTKTSFYKSKEGESLADAIFGIIGPCAKTIDDGSDFRVKCDRLEAATAEIYSKNEIEESDLIQVRGNFQQSNGESMSICDIIGDKVDVDESEDEE